MVRDRSRPAAELWTRLWREYGAPRLLYDLSGPERISAVTDGRAFVVAGNNDGFGTRYLKFLPLRPLGDGTVPEGADDLQAAAEARYLSPQEVAEGRKVKVSERGSVWHAHRRTAFTPYYFAVPCRLDDGMIEVLNRQFWEDLSEGLLPGAP